MNLTDRLRNAVHAMADTKPAKPQLESEIGVSGDFQAFYQREEARTDDITIENYTKMVDNDGTVEAVYNILTWPIQAAEYHFEVEGGGAKELKLVEDNFSLPPHKGGMTFPFELLLGDMLRGLLEGFRLYEKVWQLKDGKIVYKKLAPRDSQTVKLKRDEHGGFAGAHQETWNGTEYVNVEIPLERCFLFTYAKHRSFLYGRSAFKAAYYHYDRKHKLYYIQQLGAQSAGLPGKKVSVPDAIFNNSSKYEATLAAAEAFGGLESTIMLPDGVTIEEYKSNPMKLKDDIDHHDALIARSVLAQFLVLGQQATGSYSLSQDQSDMFIEALQSVMRQIEHHINAYLIPDLINYNFGSGIYPEFKFEDIGSDHKAIIKEAFTKLLTRTDLPADVIEGIVTEMGVELDIKMTGKELQKPEPVVPPDSKGGSPADPKAQARNNSEAVELSSPTYWRQLTEPEKRVNLSELTRKTQTADEQLLEAATAFYEGLKDDTITRLRKLLEKGDLSGLKGFALASFAPYRKALLDAMMTSYLLGKRTAADEVGAKMPQTPAKSRAYLTQQAQAVVDKQQADLEFAVKAEVTKELRKGNLSETQFGVADILARVANVFLTYVATGGSVDKGIAVSLAGSLNLGRGDSFGASGDIDRMQYSAILDDRTTQMCRDLDGSVVTYEEYRATKWVPPCHWGCRSIWVAILKDDDFKPEFRPLPAAPGGSTEPQL